MKDHWFDLLKKMDYKSGEKIIDIGGGMDPCPIADVVVDIGDFKKGGKSTLILDICSQQLPFSEDEFDIIICSQTLEDLGCPTLILSEMTRVGKRGVIEVPHRGVESLKNTRYNSQPKPDYAYEEVWHFGVGHHKWLIEEKGDALVFTPKIQYMLMRHPIPKWTGPGGITYFWDKYKTHPLKAFMCYDINEDAVDKNYCSFRRENEKYWS